MTMKRKKRKINAGRIGIGAGLFRGACVCVLVMAMKEFKKKLNGQ